MAETDVPLRDRVAALLAGLLALAAAAPVVHAVGAAIAARWDYPGDLEWMEGATLVSAQRVHDGLPIYGAPEGEYIPFIYPPLYAWTVAALGHLWPIGYPLGRVISTVGSVAGGLAGVFAARRAGASWPLAFASLGLLAACWDDSGTFYDLVRTDGLSLGLMAWAVVLLPVATRGAVLASGVLLAVAFMAKQHVALLGLPMLLWVWRAHGRALALTFAKASVGLALLFVGAMAAGTSGRFVTWLLLVPAVHGQRLDRLVPGAQIELWEALPITTSALVLTSPWWARRQPYWAAMTLTIGVVASLMRGHTGGYLNVLIPAFWVLSFLPMVVAGAWGARAQLVAAGLVAAQALTWNLDWASFNRRLQAGDSPVSSFTASRRTLTRYIPTEKDRADVALFVDQLRELPDPILIPHGPWYAVMAGKRPSFALITLWDIDYPRGVYKPDVARVEAAIAHDFQSAVLADDKLGHHFKEHWGAGPPLKVRSPATRTGWPIKLRTVWFPKADADAPAAGTPPDDARGASSPAPAPPEDADAASPEADPAAP